MDKALTIPRKGNELHMKTMMKMVVTLALLASPASAAEPDKRIVNGLIVDLAPVHQWFSTQQGERPMPHWKRLKVEAITGQSAGMDECLVSGEIGNAKIVLGNVPQPARAWLQEEGAIRNLRAQIDAAKEQVKDAHAAVRDRNIANLNNPGAGLAYVREEYERNLEKLESQLAKAEARHSQQQGDTLVLAMFTGKIVTIAGGKRVEVWDCGRPAK